MTNPIALLIGYLVSFCLGVYVAVAALRFRAIFRAKGALNGLRAIARVVPAPAPIEHVHDQPTGDEPIQNPSGNGFIQNAEDTDELYRRCLEFLQSRSIELGAHTSHVPYAEMLRQSVVTAQADGPRMLHMLGLIALSRNDLETTRRLLDRAVRADPNDAEIHNSLGYALCQEHKFLSASIILMRAATLRPDLAAAEVNLNLARAGLSGGAI
jgi:tetratricopeptide (TPR) repeat protein